MTHKNRTGFGSEHGLGAWRGGDFDGVRSFNN